MTSQSSVRALTVLAPWAALIAAGLKLVENRSWKTSWRGPLLIHQGRRVLTAPFQRPEVEAANKHVPEHLKVLGHFLALAQLTDCHEADGCCGPWAEPTGFHWTLTNVQTLISPIPAIGVQRLWIPSSELITTVRTRNPHLDLAA